MPKGEIVLGCLAPHPPHVVYAENPDQNEPVSEGGWETLRWGYNRLARKLKTIDYDALVIFTPHWQTYICLLYTSPSPRDLSTSRMPSSA